MSLLDKKTYCKLIAKDDKEYILETRIARLCPYFEKKLYEKQNGNSQLEVKFEELNSEILHCVISYLHFKQRYSMDLNGDIPEFFINPDFAYELLKALQFLKI